MAWNVYIGALGSSSGAQISCSGACSSSSRACISSSGQRLQSLEAPEALSFSRGLAFSPSGTTTLPHINYAWWASNLKSTAIFWITGTVHSRWNKILFPPDDSKPPHQRSPRLKLQLFVSKADRHSLARHLPLHHWGFPFSLSVWLFFCLPILLFLCLFVFTKNEICLRSFYAQLSLPQK